MTTKQNNIQSFGIDTPSLIHGQTVKVHGQWKERTSQTPQKTTTTKKQKQKTNKLVLSYWKTCLKIFYVLGLWVVKSLNDCRIRLHRSKKNQKKNQIFHFHASHFSQAFMFPSVPEMYHFPPEFFAFTDRIIHLLVLLIDWVDKRVIHCLISSHFSMVYRCLCAPGYLGFRSKKNSFQVLLTNNFRNARPHTK